MLLYEVDGSLGSNSFNCAAVVTAKQDAQVYELREEGVGRGVRKDGDADSGRVSNEITLLARMQL